MKIDVTSFDGQAAGSVELPTRSSASSRAPT